MTEKPDSLAVRPTAGQIAVLRPQTIGEAMELATILAKSTLVPNEYRGKPENVLVAMQLGAEVGLSPFQALQSIAVINGKPAIYGDAGLAIVRGSGLLEGMKETDDEATKTATCWMKRKGESEPVERSFSHADAERIMMFERDGNGNTIKRRLADRPTWQSFPKRMRQWRARWWAMHDLFPDLLKGMRGAEEYDRGASPLGPGDVEHGDAEADNDYQDLMPKATIVDAPAVEAPPVVEAPPDEVPAPEPPQPKPRGRKSPPPGAVPAVAPEPSPPRPAPSLAAVRPPESEADTKQSPLFSPEHTVSFEINGLQYTTAGITKEQMIQTFTLAPKADRAMGGKKVAKQILEEEFKVGSRKDLTAEQAERYLIRLQECAGEA